MYLFWSQQLYSIQILTTTTQFNLIYLPQLVFNSIYVLTTSSLYTHSILILFSFYTHSILILYSLLLTLCSLYTHSILTLYSLDTHSILTLYSLDTHSIYYRRGMGR